jgi:hypothetical protein
MAQMSIMFDFYTRKLLMQIVYRNPIAIIEHKVIIYLIMAKYIRSTSYYSWTDGTGNGQEHYALDEIDEPILIALSE